MTELLIGIASAAATIFLWEVGRRATDSWIKKYQRKRLPHSSDSTFVAPPVKQDASRDFG